MQHGLFSAAFAFTASLGSLIVLWRLPNMITAWFDGRAKLIHAQNTEKPQ